MSKKTKTVFMCQNCGAQAPKWLGRCTACGEWNTFVEEIISSEPSVVANKDGKRKTPRPLAINEIEFTTDKRIDTQSIEFNRVLGGGLVYGSLVLIGGEPGIGKSTLLLQVALQLTDKKILYVSGEESEQQIKLRAERINNSVNNCYILADTSLENIFLQAESLLPDMVVIDSIQTIKTDRIESSPGSVSQIRECANLLLRYAKEQNVPVLLIGHINKDGNIAGPKVLEHIVDTVLQFEGDTNYMYRILRAVKNRFGSTAELGIFEMQQSGLREVNNPSELLLSQTDELLSGVAIAASVEGVRPFLIEIQALVSSAAYGTPQRSATGFDLRRLSMLLAVLEKRAGFRLASKDVFLNIAGGLKINDPASDLAVIVAVLSSDLDIAIHKNCCFAGEVGLTGEIRPVTRIEQRIAEAQKLGFKSIFISKYNKKGVDFSRFNIKINFAAKIEEVVQYLFTE